MPFNQTGSNATANFGTYNDVAGNQINTKTDNSVKSTVTTGPITTGSGGSTGGRSMGKGGNAGNGGSVTIGK
ncbi:hypothetical protein PAXINDRAFT_171542 [Paxillus involutus ATCC 200175]|uniref:Uncharacterized protein n=1 Tax=Paxillus involutus ATCC 200175 TaxID=664439 RepID=A0A0C9TMV5_PAXIN|nr:hypothetical protein PAXINDRAFT_171542 [Paxillus involutus ATCC 200175]